MVFSLSSLFWQVLFPTIIVRIRRVMVWTNRVCCLSPTIGSKLCLQQFNFKCVASERTSSRWFSAALDVVMVDGQADEAATGAKCPTTHGTLDVCIVEDTRNPLSTESPLADLVLSLGPMVGPMMSNCRSNDIRNTIQYGIWFWGSSFNCCHPCPRRV